MNRSLVFNSPCTGRQRLAGAELSEVTTPLVSLAECMTLLQNRAVFTGLPPTAAPPGRNRLCMLEAVGIKSQNAPIKRRRFTHSTLCEGAGGPLPPFHGFAGRINSRRRFERGRPLAARPVRRASGPR